MHDLSDYSQGELRIVKGHEPGKPDFKPVGGRVNIRPKEPHSCEIQVAKGSVAVYVDNELVVCHKTNYSDLGVLPGTEIRDGALGLGANAGPKGVSPESGVVFHSAKVREVTGRGKILAANPNVGSGKGKGGKK